MKKIIALIASAGLALSTMAFATEGAANAEDQATKNPMVADASSSTSNMSQEEMKHEKEMKSAHHHNKGKKHCNCHEKGEKGAHHHHHKAEKEKHEKNEMMKETTEMNQKSEMNETSM